MNRRKHYKIISGYTYELPYSSLRHIGGETFCSKKLLALPCSNLPGIIEFGVSGKGVMDRTEAWKN
jgi:hypothetical protein